MIIVDNYNEDHLKYYSFMEFPDDRELWWPIAAEATDYSVIYNTENQSISVEQHWRHPLIGWWQYPPDPPRETFLIDFGAEVTCK